MAPPIRYTSPPYLSEEINGQVLVTIEIKGLQKRSKKEAKNATIHKDFHERSMCIQIDGTKGKMENRHLKLNIKQLPGVIRYTECTLKLDDDFLEVWLVKAENEPWDLRNGLETYKEENKDEQ